MTSAMGAALPDDGAEQELTVDDLAARAGVTVRNLRAYAARGLLPPPRMSRAVMASDIEPFGITPTPRFGSGAVACDGRGLIGPNLRMAIAIVSRSSCVHVDALL